MKLHSIQTVNLNSLYGTHDLNLDEAVGGASLFLIFGPTGSGKSTLMDAVRRHAWTTLVARTPATPVPS